AEAQRDDAPQNTRAVAETVEPALAVLARAAAHRHLDHAAARAQDPEQEIHLDVEALRTQVHAPEHLGTERLKARLRVGERRREEAVDDRREEAVAPVVDGRDRARLEPT